MKNEDLENYFKKIRNLTNGDNTSNSEIIDYSNGNSISIKEIEEEYYKYKDLEEEIDNYIEDEDLDDVSDADIIKEHFKNKIDEDLFLYNQAFLKDFCEYMSTKIKKQNENMRKANVIFGENGNGSLSTKITLPVPWIKKLGFSEDNKNAIIRLQDNKIIIEKEEN